MSELAREVSFAETGEKAKELMDLVLPALEGAGVRYWLDLGLLLGAIRGRRLDPWGGDVDITVAPGTQAETVLSVLERCGTKVPKVKRFSNDNAPFDKGDMRVIKTHFHGHRHPQMDLIFCKEYDEQIWWGIAGFLQAAPAEFFEPLQSYEFLGREYPIPAQPEAYLAYRYGDWTTPVKDWKRSYDQTSVRRLQ